MAKKPTYEQLQEQVAELETKLNSQTEKNSKPGSGYKFPWRKFSVGVMVGLSSLFLVFGTTAFWFNRTINNTDAYLRAVGPLVDQAPIQAAIVKASENSIYANVNITQIAQNALPPKAAFLAAPLADQIKAHTNTLLTNVVSSPQFATVWVNANRKAQIGILQLIKSSNGKGTVSVASAYQFLSTAVANTPLSVVANKTLPPKVGQIQIANVSWLPAAHDGLLALNWIQYIGLLLAAVLAVGAIWVSKHRRRTGITLSVTVAVVTILAALAVRVTRTITLSGISDSTYHAAAVSAWETFLNPLFGLASVIVTVSVIAALILWGTGPSKAARKTRSGWQYLANHIHQFIFRGHEGPALEYVRSYRHVIEWLLLAAMIILLIFAFTPLSVATVLWATLILVVIVAILEIISAKSLKPVKKKTASSATS